MPNSHRKQGDRVKRYVERGRKSRLAETEIVSIRATLDRLARWETPWCSEKILPQGAKSDLLTY